MEVVEGVIEPASFSLWKKKGERRYVNDTRFAPWRASNSRTWRRLSLAQADLPRCHAVLAL